MIGREGVSRAARATCARRTKVCDNLFIDEQGRFQMAPDDLAAFVGFLRENEVLCSAEEPGAFAAEGRS